MSNYVRGAHHRFFQLGKGLAQSELEPSKTWKILCSAIQEIPENERNVDALRGFIWKIVELNSNFYEEALDDLLKNPILTPWAVTFFDLQEAMSVC